MPNSVDDVYGSNVGVNFAKMMAEALSKQGNYVPNADMAKLPGSWMYGVPNILSALAGNQYRDIAGSQDKVLRDRMTDPNAQPGIKSYGYPASQVQGPAAPQGSSNKVASLNPSATEPSGDNISTASLPPENITGQNTGVTSEFLDKVKSIENNTGNPAYVNEYGYKGDYQFSDEEIAKYGLSGGRWKDPKLAREAAARRFTDLNNQYKAATGKDADHGTLYLMHQRGFDGAMKGIQNPDKPEWINMLNTGEGRARYDKDPQSAIAWAQRAVWANVPKKDPTRIQLQKQYGKEWYMKMTSGQFQPIWTKRFGGTNPASNEGLSPNASLTGQEGQPELAGGPTADTIDQTEQGAVSAPGAAPIETGATKTAQAFPTTPTTVGPQGAIPPANPIESDAQLQARLRYSDDPDKVLESYLKRKEGREYETATGKQTVTPTTPGQQPIVTERDTRAFPLSIGDLHLQLIPNGQGGFSAALPGGGTKDFKSLDEVWKWAQEGHARGTELNTRAEKQATRYEDIKGHAEQTYQTTADRGTQLKLASQLVNDPKFISGSFKDQREMISKFFTTLKLAPPGSGSDVTQAFVKLVAGNILDDIKSLGGQGLGQVRQKEMDIIEKMNATPNMSPGAVRAVVNLMQKTNDRMQNHNDQVLDYAAEHGGNVDAGFYRKMQKFYRDNPLISPEEMANYRELFKLDKDKGTTTTEGDTKKKWRINEKGAWEFK